MYGAAMDFRQEEALHPQNKGPSPGYHLQRNSSYQPQNPHLQYSKAMSHPSDSYVDLELWQSRETYGVDFRDRSRSRVSDNDNVDTRRPRTPVRKPMDLPVPNFEIDENYVGVIPNKKTDRLIENSKDLDLDTRINLLIKSRALSGMHPIFSELSESEDFSHSSDDSLTEFSLKSKHNIPNKVPPSEEKVLCHESFDDPETPLSRPPSPFISRASYLYWFNKAIELKQLAKAQEKALIEQATKKLLKNNSATKTNNQENSKLNSNAFLKILLDEVGRELKEAMKQEFINQIIENTAFSSLENWWESQKVCEENFPENSVVNSSTNDENNTKVLKFEKVATDSKDGGLNCQPQRSTSPEVPFPWKTLHDDSERKVGLTRNQRIDEEEVLRSNTLVEYSLVEGSEVPDADKSPVLTENHNLLQSNKVTEELSDDASCKYHGESKIRDHGNTHQLQEVNNVSTHFPAKTTSVFLDVNRKLSHDNDKIGLLEDVDESKSPDLLKNCSENIHSQPENRLNQTEEITSSSETNGAMVELIVGEGNQCSRVCEGNISELNKEEPK